MQRVGIVVKPGLRDATEHLVQIASWLRGRHVEPVFDRDTAELAGGAPGERRVVERDALPRHVDMVLVLGGDGTLLATAGRIGMAGVDIPILGVNFGGLGFLTEVTLPEIYASLETAIAGTAQIENRMMLCATVTRAAHAAVERIVLNDVVVTQGALSRVIDLSVSIGSEFMMRVRGDGLIIATPTGSTAYNLASGGPIVHPGVDALTITPIAPHMLTNRPVVVPGASEIRVQPFPADRREEIFATFDGQFVLPLDTDDAVTVRKAAQPLRLIRALGRGYFQVLREKLKWAER